MKDKKLSLKIKMSLIFIVFSIILLAILFTFQVFFLEKFYEKTRIKEIEKSVGIIEKNIEYIDDIEYEDFLVNLANKSNICLEIFNTNGQILYSVDNIENCDLHNFNKHTKKDLIKSALDNTKGNLTYYEIQDTHNMQHNNSQSCRNDYYQENKEENNKAIIYTKALQIDNSKNIVIMVDAVISPLNSTIKTIYSQFYSIAIFVIILSILISYFVAKTICKPIENINKNAKFLTKGEYKNKEYKNSYKEIDELSKTLDNVAKDLLNLENLRKDFLGNVSHDLRTPLTLISGYADMMCDIEDELKLENAQIISEEAKRLTELVNNLLSLQTDQKTLSNRKYNFTISTKQAIDRINKFIRKDEFIIKFNYKEEVFINADESKIYQVMYNLIINAINHSEKEKEIIVNQIIEGDFVKLEVIDKGIGIEQEQIKFIWDRYFKGKGDNITNANTGIGLSIVKSIMEMQGGKFGVISEIGKGSNFWFMLRIYK